MADHQDVKQKDIKDRIKDQLEHSTLKPTPKEPSGGINITINGDNVDLGYGVGNTININYTITHYSAPSLVLGPFIYIGIIVSVSPLSIWRAIKQKAGKTFRQLSRKISTNLPKMRQITRNRKTNPKSPQPQSSRHFRPNPDKSHLPPYIPLNHILSSTLNCSAG
ncbi:hypothetical protein [Methylomonas sp. ZR1]|uniref:hypothetical protein n=1 Tax=Methylomonas sp. ZR1 TaxID=1797072 RepID=UPI0014910F74|nr:hypothetical protein [Methylomonas sp. ZR1]NOV29213.1 hypothetical protein [Methylomonas sp. ZR1]